MRIILSAYFDSLVFQCYRKDYDQNRLMGGLLQISNKTQIVIDETKLQQGTLLDRGS